MTTSFIIWNASPEIFHGLVNSDSFLSFLGNLRWYGLLFATGFIIGQRLMQQFFKAEGKPQQDVDIMTFYVVIGTVLGARLGHCFFYEPAYFLAHPLEILQVWNGGLASHGATVGILLAVYLYSRRVTGQSYLWVLDRVVITVALGGMLIRTANFINAEIVGKPTNSAFGVVFAAPTRIMLEETFADKGLKSISVASTGKDTVINGQAYSGTSFSLLFDPAQQDEQTAAQLAQSSGIYTVDQFNSTGDRNFLSGHTAYAGVTKSADGIVVNLTAWGLPRHPAQLYEAFSCLVVFLLLYALWRKQKERTPEGQLFGLFVLIVFGLRFFYEFLKENQVGFEDNLTLNMGQILSIPLVLVGAFLTFRHLLRQRA